MKTIYHWCVALLIIGGLLALVLARFNYMNKDGSDLFVKMESEIFRDVPFIILHDIKNNKEVKIDNKEDLRLLFLSLNWSGKDHVDSPAPKAVDENIVYWIRYPYKCDACGNKNPSCRSCEGGEYGFTFLIHNDGKHVIWIQSFVRGGQGIMTLKPGYCNAVALLCRKYGLGDGARSNMPYLSTGHKIAYNYDGYDELAITVKPEHLIDKLLCGMIETGIIIQTISTLKDGITPTAAERAAAERIRAAFPNDELCLVPKRNSSGAAGSGLVK